VAWRARIDEALKTLSGGLDFQAGQGLNERAAYRELFLYGLTQLDKQFLPFPTGTGRNVEREIDALVASLSLPVSPLRQCVTNHKFKTPISKQFAQDFITSLCSQAGKGTDLPRKPDTQGPRRLAMTSGNPDYPQFDDGKAPDALRTIGEVAKAMGIRQHVLRYWEEKFPMLTPVKRSGGRRYYRPENIRLIAAIDRLVRREGYTLRGARMVIEGKRSEPVARAEPAGHNARAHA